MIYSNKTKLSIVESSMLGFDLSNADEGRIGFFHQGVLRQYCQKGRAGGLSATMTSILDDLMQGCTTDMLDALVVHKGPGSFTGLRIALATAYGIGVALQKPIYQWTGFEVLLHQLQGDIERLAKNAYLLVAFETGRHDLYLACYHMNDNKQHQIAPPAAVDKDGFLKILDQVSFANTRQYDTSLQSYHGPIYAVGSGALRLVDWGFDRENLIQGHQHIALQSLFELTCAYRREHALDITVETNMQKTNIGKSSNITSAPSYTAPHQWGACYLKAPKLVQKQDIKNK